MGLNDLTPEELEKKKQIAEIEKLERENRDAVLPFHLKSDNWGKILTFISVLLTLLVGQCSGWFDTQQKNLETKKEKLAIDIRDFD